MAAKVRDVIARRRLNEREGDERDHEEKRDRPEDPADDISQKHRLAGSRWRGGRYGSHSAPVHAVPFSLPSTRSAAGSAPGVG